MGWLRDWIYGKQTQDEITGIITVKQHWLGRMVQRIVAFIVKDPRWIINTIITLIAAVAAIIAAVGRWK